MSGFNPGPIAREAITGTCDAGDCGRLAVSLAYDERTSGLIPVCRHHILVYRVASVGRWQGEDEFAGLRFARRARWRWLAQWLILLDQRAAVSGRVSRGQARLTAASESHDSEPTRDGERAPHVHDLEAGATGLGFCRTCDYVEGD